MLAIRLLLRRVNPERDSYPTERRNELARDPHPIERRSELARDQFRFEAFRTRYVGASLLAIFSLLAILAAPSLASADASCKVLDPELQDRYEGGCVNGLAEGEGRASGRASYEGGFHLGMKNGQGQKRWANGDSYSGGFGNDKRNGRGTYRWVSGAWAGEQYQGDYVDNRRQGFGIYTWPTGDRYEGPWDKDAMTGPPTPMMIQRNRARAGALKELGKPGLTVCKLETLGIGNVAKRAAKVTAVKGEALEILQDGEARIVDPFGWYPCP